MKLSITKESNIVDWLKVLFALLVVTIHTHPLKNVSETMNFWLLNYVARIAVPMFFAFSGYVLSRKIKQNPRYFKAWCLNLVKLLVTWTFVYWIYISLFEFSDLGGSNWFSWSFEFLAYSLFHGYFHLWYLASLIVGGVLVYHLRNRNQKKLLLISIPLYLLGLFAVSWSAISNPVIDTVLSPVHHFFDNVRNSPLNCLPFLFIGFYLERHMPQYDKKAVILLLALFSVGYYYEVKLVSRTIPRGYDMYLSLIPIVFCAMVLLQNSFSSGHSPFLSKLSLNIYLTHILILKIFERYIPVGMMSLFIMLTSIALACLLSWAELQLGKRKRQKRLQANA